ncbi:MAG: hypothetical protein GY953_38395, partial [bacterium]|nr:hypothetical protein [bacterium]
MPDGDGAFAAEQTRRLFMELGEGLPERDALAAPELIDGGMLAGGGLTREEIAALRANAERAKARAEAASAGEIEDQIQAGSAGVLEVEAAVRTGQIPESAATRLADLARNAAAGREKAAMGAARIADVMLGRGAAGDPADPETRAAVEAFTESTLPDPMAMVPAETAARIVRQTGILPSRVAVSLKAGLAEGADPARRNETLVTVMLLKSQAPGVLEAEIARLRAAEPLKPLTTARDLATYDIAGSFVAAGIEPDEAFRLAQAEAEAREVQPIAQLAGGDDGTEFGDEDEIGADSKSVPTDNDTEAGILPEGEDEAAARAAEEETAPEAEDLTERDLDLLLEA